MIDIFKREIEEELKKDTERSNIKNGNIYKKKITEREESIERKKKRMRARKKKRKEHRTANIGESKRERE